VTPTPNDAACRALRGPLGAEDAVKWKDVVLLSNIDSLPLWSWPGPDLAFSNPKAASPGAIWVLRGAKAPALEKAEMVGFPEGVPFHPHGLGLLGDVLYAVNHAYENGGERIDSFHLSLREDGNVKLTYKATSKFGAEFLGIVNSVVPVSPTEFYVTKYLPWADNMKGRALDKLSKLRDVLYLTNPFGIKWTHIYYCNVKTGHSDQDCKLVGPPGAMWNGITSSPDGQTVYVYDLGDKAVSVFDRATGGDLILKKKLPVPLLGDNIRFDESDGLIWIGGMAHTGEGFQYMEDSAHHHNVIPKGGASAGGRIAPGHVSSVDPKTGAVQTHLIHSGRLLGAPSVGIRYQDHVILSSFIDDGLIICPVQK